MNLELDKFKNQINIINKIYILLQPKIEYFNYIAIVKDFLEQSINIYLCNPEYNLINQLYDILDDYVKCITVLKYQLLPLLRKSKIQYIELDKCIKSLNYDFYQIITKNIEYCSECKTYLIRYRNEMFCQKCNVFKGKLYLYRDEDLDDDIKQNKSNILKHFDSNLNRIYGIIDDKTVLPKCGLIQLRKKLDSCNFDITKQVHYTYSLINQLKNIKSINCTCSKKNHKIISVKKQVNYIISQIYPEITIPRLLSVEYDIVKNLFLAISSAYQQLYPGNYSIAYQYTLHRILHMNYGERKNILELLRFIYPQKQISFRTKDMKLELINNKIKCFEPFQYTPSDIYTNISHYMQNRKICMY